MRAPVAMRSSLFDWSSRGAAAGLLLVLGGACGGEPTPAPASGGAGPSGGTAPLAGAGAGDSPVAGNDSGGQAGQAPSGGKAGDTVGGVGGRDAAGGGGATAAGGPSDGGSGAADGPRWLGRVDARDPSAVKLGWSASGLVASVEGPKISVRLQTDGAETAFFQPVIDGEPAPRFEVPSGPARTVVLGEGLGSGAHRIELYRESEGSYGYSTFLGFVDGEVVGAPRTPERFIEVIGDSISAGYGSLGKDVHPPWDQGCTFSLATESAYVTYGALLGRALGAEVSIVARSGWGIYRDNQGNTQNVLPSLFTRTLGTNDSPTYDFARQPDAVIINLGTNDSALGDPGKPYEDAYVAFLKTVRQKYASAWIFLTIGPMTGEPLLSAMRAHLAQVVSASGDAKVVAVPLETQDSATTGCDYHPDIDEHQRMAKAMEPVIATKLGW